MGEGCGYRRNLRMEMPVNKKTLSPSIPPPIQNRVHQSILTNGMNTKLSRDCAGAVAALPPPELNLAVQQNNKKQLHENKTH
jgi:hypothetical protein